MRGARVLSICLAMYAGATASAADVPAPPSEASLAPRAVFSSDATYVSPVPNAVGEIEPHDVYSPSMSATTSQPHYHYSTPVNDEFFFAGYNGGGVLPIGGTVDELFNAGIQIVVETGWQTRLADDGWFSGVALVGGFSNQTIWGKDQRSFILPNGDIHGTETLSISTFKSGIYFGHSVNGFDFFTGAYTKIGAAVLNEDREFFDPSVKYIPVQGFDTVALAGGGGLEAGIALWKFNRGSLALIGGVECLYVGTFDTPGSDWLLFTTTGLQWEFDITDGILPDWEFNSRHDRKQLRRARRRCR